MWIKVKYACLKLVCKMKQFLLSNPHSFYEQSSETSIIKEVKNKMCKKLSLYPTN